MKFIGSITGKPAYKNNSGNDVVSDNSWPVDGRFRRDDDVHDVSLVVMLSTTLILLAACFISAISSSENSLTLLAQDIIQLSEKLL